MQKTIASVNRQWLSLQAHTADRTQELSEAADLAHAVEDVSQSVETWVTQAEAVVGVELDWSDFDSVREQLKSHKVTDCMRRGGGGGGGYAGVCFVCAAGCVSV